MKKTLTNTGYIYAMLAAVLFGASTPAAKFLLDKIDPWLLAGLLYLGSAIGLLIIYFFQLLFSNKAKEASLKQNDLLWLSSAVLL
ncbi:MAG: EamA family transporter, partial [Gammaproteobacteria bacterium]|nr:EamA family transporter [Gammaproteobacteria bacterium]